jgi:hypothetical protein
MAEPVNIELNPANWITVLIIVLVSFTALGFLTRLWQQKQSQKSGA